MQQRASSTTRLCLRAVSNKAPNFSSRAGSTMTINSSRPSLLFLDDINLAKDEYAALAKDVDIQHMTAKSRDEFMSDLDTKHKKVNGIYRHFKAGRSIAITGRFDYELINRLPPSLKFIAHNGAGYDQIDVDDCTARSIQIANVPTVVDGATADTAMFLILSCLRQFPLALAHAQAGTFNSKVPLSNDPTGKVLGILGMGGIGSALARRAVAFGMKVGYHNRNRLSPEAEADLGATYFTSKDELLRASDVVSLNLPLTAKTKHTISTAELEMMKSTAILVNTARGPIVDEAALITALEKGDIGGAGLDVYEDEPHIPEALLKSPRAICLPHIGTVSYETQREMEAVCMRNLVQGLQTGRMPYVVAEQRAAF